MGSLQGGVMAACRRLLHLIPQQSFARRLYIVHKGIKCHFIVPIFSNGANDERVSPLLSSLESRPSDAT